METIPAFDISLNKWKTIKTLSDPNIATNNGYPEPRKFHSCVQQQTDNGIEVVIAGGSKADSVYLDDIWKLNLTTHQWTKFAQTSLPYQLFFHDAATNGNGCMYTFGGTTQRSDRMNDLHKMWIKIPKLSEISWEAMIHYWPRLYSMEPEKLRLLGVPDEFVNRVVRSQRVQYDF